MNKQLQFVIKDLMLLKILVYYRINRKVDLLYIYMSIYI